MLRVTAAVIAGNCLVAYATSISFTLTLIAVVILGLILSAFMVPGPDNDWM